MHIQTYIRGRSDTCMGPPAYFSESQGIIETVDFTRRTCTEKGADHTNSREGDDHRWLTGIQNSTSNSWISGKQSQSSTKPN